MKEEFLIKKAGKGDGDAFGQLYDKYMPAIYRFVLVKVGNNKADAEDITHQAFLRAWQGVRRYKEKGFPFSSWLYRIAYNAVVDFYRTSRSHLDIDLVSENSISHVPEFGKNVDDVMRLGVVKDALGKLEDEQQNVLIMRFVNEMSGKEVAEVIGKSEGAVRVIQHRALKRLKKIIDETERDHTTIKEV